AVQRQDPAQGTPRPFPRGGPDGSRRPGWPRGPGARGGWGPWHGSGGRRSPARSPGGRSGRTGRGRWQRPDPAGLPASAGGRGSMVAQSLDATRPTRSTRRFEYPHSLSYQPMTFTRLPMVMVERESKTQENSEPTTSLETMGSS